MPAQVTELMFALAGHMVASLNFLYDDLAVGALTVAQVVLEEFNLLLLAAAGVLLQVAFGTKLGVAGGAYPRLVWSELDHSRAVLSGAQLESRVAGRYIKVVNLHVLLLRLLCQVLVKRPLKIHLLLTALVRTLYFFKHLDLVHYIVIHTIPAVKVLT